MADAVTSQTIIDTEKRVVMKFTNLSDDLVGKLSGVEEYLPSFLLLLQELISV